MALEGQGYLPICILDFTVWLEEKKTSLGLKLMRSEATMLENWRLL